MALLFEQAHDEDAPDVAQFLASIGISVPAEKWERIFSSDAPLSARSRPMLVRLEDGPVHAFGAVRDIAIHTDEDLIPARVLHDFYVSDDDEYSWRAAGILLDEVCRGTTLAIAAGVSMHGARTIESQRWLALGEFSRWRVEPEKRDKPKPLPVVDVADAAYAPKHRNLEVIRVRRDPECIAWLNGEDGAVHAIRDSQGNPLGFARRVAAAQRGTHEWHVTDLLFDGGDAPEFFRRIGIALRATGEPAYMSVFAPPLEVEISRSGWERQRSRWPVYTYFGSSRERELSTRLARGDAWFLTPMDVGLDRE
jgi:hypothetical protein